MGQGAASAAAGLARAGPCGLAQCSCLPGGAALSLTEYREDAGSRNAEEIGVSLDNFDSDGGGNSSGEGSEGSDSTPTRLSLARHRVFSSHLRFKFHDHYRIDRILGEGSYGNVYEAFAVGPTGTPAEPMRRVAAKCFSMTGTARPREGETETAAEARRLREVASRRASFEKERSVLSRLEHPHIIKMFECFEERDNLWVVMELCRGGELYECIAQQVRSGRGGGVEETHARTFFRQMLHALSYLHACRVVHRDVKTENFLLLGAPGSPEAHIIKLCDFGTATRLSDEQPRAMERIGTLSYTAPEVYARRGASVLADMWSLGVVLYVLLVGASPFRITGEEPRQDTVDRIAAGRFDQERPAWQNLSWEARDLVCKFLVVAEEKRLRGPAALRHLWVEPPTMPARPREGPPTADGQRPLFSPRRYLSPQAWQEQRFSDYARFAPALLSALARFAQLDALQQMVLVVCAQMTPEVHLLSLSSSIPWYDLFFVLDADEDGRLEIGEFARGLAALLLLGSAGGIPEEQLRALGKALDVDGSGMLEWAEWSAVGLIVMQDLMSATEPLLTVFRALDRPSSDGLVGVADVLAVLNCGAAGENLPSGRARDMVCTMLARWASTPPLPVAVPTLPPNKLAPAPGAGHPRRRRRVRQQVVPPSLVFADFRRVLANATMGVDLGPIWAPGAAIGTQQGGCFNCCQTDGPMLQMAPGMPMPALVPPVGQAGHHSGSA